MPSRSTRPERRVPARLPLLNLLPKREIVARFLLVAEILSQATLPLRQKLGVPNSRGHELTIAVPLLPPVEVPYVEVYRSLAFVRVALVDEGLDVNADLGHVLAYPGHDVGAGNVEVVHVLEELGLPVPGERVEGHSGLVAALDNLVVYVRYVHAKCNVVVEVSRQDASDDVEAEVGSGVAHVGCVVDGRTAHVPTDGVAAGGGLKERLGPCQRVHYLEHGTPLWSYGSI
mmetsp:Transcript_14549/g.29863  ORF Transcript_14549/g.29863 Transcript_14549/m.29863 type:complete len:230 (-) Transcript_14549:97-786(-)